MTVFYLDFENGNDANAGTSFATRWKSITSGATAARIAPGDEIRIMASPDPTLVGNATWTQYSKTVTLASSVTQMIYDGEANWTPSTNVTSATNTSSFKEGTRAIGVSIAAAFTTGKAAYFPTGTLDLSGYQQVSFWIMTNNALAANVLSLRLCTDTAGNVPVHTIPIPALPASLQFSPITVDLGAPMNSAIQSIALYQEVDIAAVNPTIDNIIACKASSDPASLTLTSLIGKVCNLSWSASTAYTTGDERKPTQPMRNGFRYKATTGGTTGSTEPTWPEEIGKTVTDGTVIWTCTDLEDTWYGIQSINGTTVKLDNHPNTAGNAGRGYAGNTETVATYKRETIKTPMIANTTTVWGTFQDTGADGSPITYTGGWDRTGMTVQSGETWIDGQNGLGQALSPSSTSWNYLTLINLNGVRYYHGIFDQGKGWAIYNSHWNNCAQYGLRWNSSIPTLTVRGMCLNNNALSGFQANNPGMGSFSRVSMESNNNGLDTQTYRVVLAMRDFSVRNNASFGVSHASFMDSTYTNGRTGNNASGAFQFNSGGTRHTLRNILMPESTPFTFVNNSSDLTVYSEKHNQTADNHLITMEGGNIVSATDQRYGTTGISWKFRPTSTTRNSAYSLKLSVAKIRCAANQAVSLTIPTRRDNANIKGQLVVLGGQIAGVPTDVAVNCQPALNTWEVSSALMFTPTEDGVVEVLFRCWDGVGTTNNFWISARDLAVS